MPSIVVVTNGNYFAARILEDLFRRRHRDVLGVVLVRGDYRGLTGSDALWSALRTSCLPYVLAKCLFIAGVALSRLLGRRIVVQDLAESYEIPTVDLDSVRSSGFMDQLRAWAPDLLVSVSCPQRLPDPSFTEPQFGGVNIHSSLLPSYAGLAPYYWVLANGETTTGITVHHLTSQFDEGHVLVDRQLQIRPRESAMGLFARLAEAGSPALLEAVELAEASAQGRPQELEGRTYFSQPDWSSYWSLRRNRHRVVSLRDLTRLPRPSGSP